MADLADVVKMLAGMASAALYPNGAGQPSILGSAQAIIRAGWPVPAQLDDILAAGNMMLSVYPMPGMDKNTTRFPEEMAPQNSIPAPQLMLSVFGNQITIGGTINPGEAPTATVNYQAYSYAVQQGDTLATVAAALAAMIPGATVSGNVIEINGAFDIEVAVSVPVVMQAELARQSKVFMLVFWCPTPTIRDLAVPAVDVSFKQQTRITMLDQSVSRLIYRGTLMLDTAEKQRIYRRDLRYEVEYQTTVTEIDQTVTSFSTTLTPTNGVPKSINN